MVYDAIVVLQFPPPAVERWQKPGFSEKPGFWLEPHLFTWQELLMRAEATFDPGVRLLLAHARRLSYLQPYKSYTPPCSLNHLWRSAWSGTMRSRRSQKVSLWLRSTRCTNSCATRYSIIRCGSIATRQ